MISNPYRISVVATCVLVAVSCAELARAQVARPTASPGNPGPSPTLTKHADEIRTRVEKIGVGQRITIVRFDGIEHYGTIRAISASSVEVAEVDIKQAVADAFVDIKKVRKGYGGINWVSGKRPNPVWGWVAAAAIFVPLLVALRNLD